jgi:hypothetical protein
VWVLWLNSNGTVRKDAKLDSPEVGPTYGVYFGSALSVISAEGSPTRIAVGAPGAGGGGQGAVWLVSLDMNGSVVGAPKKISSLTQAVDDR